MLIKQPVVVCLAFLVINMTRDARKPLYIDVIDDNMEKEERATMLSLGSQLKSIFTVVIAPAIGYVADTYSLSKGFVALALLLLVIFPFSWNSKGEK
jgi:nitrate reductase gamma subunit